MLLKANELDDFQEIEIFGKPALYADLRLDKSTLPSGIYAYDIRHGDDNYFCTLEHNVLVNHAGTVLSREKLLSLSDKYREIGEDDLAFDAGECRTLKEFMNKYPASKYRRSQEMER